MASFQHWPAEAAALIAALARGETVYFNPVGGSMTPHIKSGQRVKAEPVVPADLKVGDVVLCKVGKSIYVHFVKKLGKNVWQIGNAHGRVNGWIGPEFIYGKVTPL